MIVIQNPFTGALMVLSEQQVLASEHREIMLAEAEHYELYVACYN